MIRRISAAVRAVLDYCETCGWWSKPGCGH